MSSPLAIKKQMLRIWQRQHDIDSKNNDWCSILKAQQLANQITQLTDEITALEAAEAAAKSPPEKSCEQLLQELCAKINAKTAASSSLASSSPASLSPASSSPASSSIQHDTQHDTQMASTHPRQNPQQITMQSPEKPAPAAPEQRAPPATAPTPERFKQEIDYKYDGLCTMRHLSKLIFTIAINNSGLVLHCSAPKNGFDGWKHQFLDHG